VSVARYRHEAVFRLLKPVITAALLQAQADEPRFLTST
jgi:hypothetical protein